MNKPMNFIKLMTMATAALVSLASADTVAPQPRPDKSWTYKMVAGQDLTMDVFLPEGYGEPGRTFPFLVNFHGGSWDKGSPANHYPDCAYWAKRGMVAASANYRLRTRDKVQVPLECLKDAKAAIRFVRAHAKELQIDPERIVVSGDSAGGMLAASTALIESDATSHPDDPKVSCIPNALILHCPYWKTGCSPELTPPNFVRPSLPPMILFLGDSDQAIPVESLKQFHESLKSKGNVSEFHVGTGGKHGFANGRNPKNAFFYWVLGLQDAFLVRQGILQGPPVIQRPPGVRELQEGTDFTSYR